MRIGLVGYGGWGRVHASAIGRVEGLSLSGVVAGDDASAEQAAHDLPGVPVHRTFDALLADSNVDLVDIVGPNHLHADMAIKALEAGKHVLLEKPMATTLADSERLVAAAERSGRHCGIVLQLRVSRQWARVRELIAEGALGQVRFANLT
ncbi:MAG TPA: Gfo/Idh/MocA family oxidoreductase, partial [Reyranella sp.]|nr:Gfo/Idh/MocA family oxidoreductase [Reyranella sp.]